MAWPGNLDRSQQRCGVTELLGVLSLACDAGVGLPQEHTLRVCYIATHLAAHMGLSAQQQNDVYHTALLKDAGCTSWSTQLATFILNDEIAARRDFLFYSDPASRRDILGWVMKHVGSQMGPLGRAGRIMDFMTHGRDFTREGYQSAVEVARRIAHRLGLGQAVQDSLLAVFEQWDGKGMPRGLRGDAIPLASRIVFPSIYIEVFHRTEGADAALMVLDQRSGKAFDPAVVAAFKALAENKSFWAELEQGSIWETAVNMRQRAHDAPVDSTTLEAVAMAFADFVDLKSFHLNGHSRRVAELAADMANRLQLPEAEVSDIRHAALMHDLGLVAVPSFLINQPQDELDHKSLTRVQQHPRNGANLLARVPALEHIASIIAAHHEQPDGRGFPAGLTRPHIPRGARILAVADHFDDITHDAPGRLALTPENALASLENLTPDVLDTEAFEALRDVQESTRRPPARASRPDRPAGLTDREVEVLRLAATGLSRKEMAHQLVVTENTVRRHLENIYSKLGVSTRVAAGLFAMEHGLLD